jgi:hypothetical protein
MALITDWSNNRFGVPAPQSYTRITEISVKRRITFATPPEPGQPSPGVLATHVVQFRTETYLNKDLALGGGSPIEEHGYTFFPITDEYGEGEPVGYTKVSKKGLPLGEISPVKPEWA